jgi:hypothetical protein
MTPDAGELPSRCPNCDAQIVSIRIDGPSPADIYFDCGCRVPFEVARALLSGAPFGDPDPDSDATGGDGR